MKKQFLFGQHAVTAALKNPKRKNHKLYVTHKSVEKLGSLPKEIEIKIVEAHAFKDLVPEGAVHQQLVLETNPLPFLSIEDFCKTSVSETRLVILDQVTDPHNVGNILRSTAALGGAALVVTDAHSSDLTSGTVAKVASGALEVVPIINVINLVQALTYLKKNDFWCYGLDERGHDISSVKNWSGKIALVFGAEGKGLRRLTKERCDSLLRLPTESDFQTLNVSTTVAVTLFATRP